MAVGVYERIETHEECGSTRRRFWVVSGHACWRDASSLSIVAAVEEATPSSSVERLRRIARSSTQSALLANVASVEEMSMPSVINQVIIPLGTNLPPGGRFMTNPVDVQGTETVAINVSITSPNASVIRRIYFGPSPNGGFSLAFSESFSPDNALMRSVPTLSPQFFVVVENHGATPTNCDGWMYAVRKVP
jgi:hypothetical protein